MCKKWFAFRPKDGTGEFESHFGRGGLWHSHEIPVGLEGHGVRSDFPADVSHALVFLCVAL